VLFPEPFGPRQPRTCPGCSEKLTSFTAGIEEYDFESALASSMPTLPSPQLTDTIELEKVSRPRGSLLEAALQFGPKAIDKPM
jgi:hypothetical protein